MGLSPFYNNWINVGFSQTGAQMLSRKAPVGARRLDCGAQVELILALETLFELTPFGGCHFSVKLPIGDQSCHVLTDHQCVAKLNFTRRLAPDDGLHVGFVDAEDLFGVGHRALADDAFVGLLDRAGYLAEHSIDARDDPLGLAFTEVSLRIIGGEAVAVAASMLTNGAQQAFHLPEHPLCGSASHGVGAGRGSSRCTSDSFAWQRLAARPASGTAGPPRESVSLPPARCGSRRERAPSRPENGRWPLGRSSPLSTFHRLRLG